MSGSCSGTVFSGAVFSGTVFSGTVSPPAVGVTGCQLNPADAMALQAATRIPVSAGAVTSLMNR